MLDPNQMKLWLIHAVTCVSYRSPYRFTVWNLGGGERENSPG